MKVNMGFIDRIVRIILAITALVLYLSKVLTGFYAIIFGVLAAIFLLTSVIGFCPSYLLWNRAVKREQAK